MTRTLRYAALAAAASLLAGCGAAAEKVSEKAAEQIIEEQTGGQVDVDALGDGSMEIQTEDGSLSIGTGEVPKEWPDDIDLPEGAIQSGTTTDSSDGRLVSVVIQTGETPEALLERYQDALADWEVSGEYTSSGGGSTLAGAQFDIEGRRVTVVASDGAGEGGRETYFTISHTAIE